MVLGAVGCVRKEGGSAPHTAHEFTNASGRSLPISWDLKYRHEKKRTNILEEKLKQPLQGFRIEKIILYLIQCNFNWLVHGAWSWITVNNKSWK